MEIYSVFQSGSPLNKYANYRLEDGAIFPEGESKLHYIFDQQEAILNDFMKLIVIMDIERTEAKTADNMQDYLTNREPALILGFVRKYGLFGVRLDRISGYYYERKRDKNGVIGYSATDQKILLLTTNADDDMYDMGYASNYYGEIPVDGIPISGTMPQEEYFKLFPYDGKEYGESIGQIKNNPRFVELQSHILGDKKRRMLDKNTLPDDLLTRNVTAICFIDGKLSFKVKSLIEAISIMYTMNLSNQNGKILKPCAAKNCSVTFSTTKNSNPDKERQYCSKKCRDRSEKQRKRNPKEAKN